MSSVETHPSMNPTVEEVVDDSLKPPNTSRSDGDGNSLSWPEVFSRHESVLSSHLEFLNSFKGHVRDSDAVRTVSSMVEKTNKLLTQFNVVKKQVINKRIPFAKMGNSLSSQSNASESAPVYSSDDKPPRPARKRRRLDPDASNSEPEVPELKSTPKSVPKRTRTGRSIPGDDEDVRNVTPVSMETEDISEEVDRRLRIKEERHRKKDAKPEKRKRESMASNESTHSSPRGVSVKPRSKKTKPNDFSDTMDKEEAVYLQGPGGIKKRDSDDTTKKSGPDVNVGAKCTKRRESDHSQSEEKRVSKRTKRETFSNA